MRFTQPSPEGLNRNLRFLALSADLAGIYARDDSETANLSAISAIGAAFQAEAAALFYVQGSNKFKMCLAGARFPITLGEERFRSLLAAHSSESKVCRFGNWALPGIERSLPHWLSVRVYSTGDPGGYVFLGGSDNEWGDEDSALLGSVADAIAPIVEVRRQRDAEETNRREAEALLIRQEKLASIGALAAGVAHEINNPLGFLISNILTLEKRFRSMESAWEDTAGLGIAALDELRRKHKLADAIADAKAIFSESRDGLRRIRDIVSNLKSFSRIDSGRCLERYDINAGLESTLVVVGNEIKYVAEVRKNLGKIPSIQAIGGEINQVFLNIILNAAQAITDQKRKEKGSITLETSADKEHVFVMVRDDGPGIPAEIQNRIFDPFFTTKRPGGGTGLGLSISYDIVVNRHGGSLWLESEPGMGTVFHISLPIGWSGESEGTKPPGDPCSEGL